MLRFAIVLALVAGTWAAPAAFAEEVPDALKMAGAVPSAQAKALSRPFVEATRKARPAVVKIINYRKDRRGNLRATQSGSGFIISREGHVLTNRHVILDADQIVVQLDDGRAFSKVKKLGQDPRSDVAILRIENRTTRPLPVAALGDSDALEVGEWVIAIGAPFQLASSVSVGVVSATGRTGVVPGRASNEDFIQTDAALNPGNSGGPLINLDGHVIGINTAIETGGYSRANAGIGFTIPINLARAVAVSLIKRGVAKRGYLGVNVETVGGLPRVYNAIGLEQMGIRAQTGIKIVHVIEDSPAAKAGLKVGDIVTEVDGRPFKDIRILYARLAQAGPGGELELRVYTGTRGRRVIVRLGEEQLPSFGVIVQDLDPDKARELGLPADTRGVVVTEIQKGSIAARADDRNRLLPGDVIVRIDWPRNQMVIENRRQFEQMMARFLVEPQRVVRFVIRTKKGLFKVHLPGR